MPASAEATLGTRAHESGGLGRRPAFLLLVLGQTVSQLGDKLHHVALLALVAAGARTETGGIELAKLSVVFTAPVVLFGPLAGALVDRWNKRLTMLVCDAARAVIVLLIPWAYARTEHLWVVYVIAFFVFFIGLFFNTAKMALIPDLVSRRELLQANAMLTSVGRVATVIGIVGGGLIIGAPMWGRMGWAPYDAGFYLDGASFLLSALTLAGILLIARRRIVNGTDPEPHVPARTRRHLLADVREVVRLVKEIPGLRFVFGSLILVAAFASTVYVAMTVAVQSIMGRGTVGVSMLGGALALGMVIGSLLVGSLGAQWPRERLVMAGIVAIGALMVLSGVFFSFQIFLPVAIVGGALLAPVMVAQDTLLHEHAPDSRRGVVFSAKDLLLAGAFAASAFAVGGAVLLFSNLGVREPYRWILGLVGSGIMVLSAVGGVLSRRPEEGVPVGLPGSKR